MAGVLLSVSLTRSENHNWHKREAEEEFWGQNSASKMVLTCIPKYLAYFCLSFFICRRGNNSMHVTEGKMRRD